MEKIWGSFSYIAAVIIAALITGWQQPKKKYFAFRVIFGFIVCFGALYAYDQLIALAKNDTLHFVLRIFDGLVVFFGVLAMLRICFSGNFWTGLFCGTVGYCMQHMTKMLSDIFGRLLHIQQWWLNAIVIVAVTAICYWIIFVFVLKKRRGENFAVDNALQTVVSAIVIIFSLGVYLIAIRMIRKTDIAQQMIIIIETFSFIIALLIFFFEFGLLSNRRLTEENNSMMQMLEKESQQYRIDQEKINIINIKCHDIAEHIAYLKKLPDSQDRNKYISDLQNDISIFGQLIKTGNNVLDMLLSDKCLICEQNKIQLSCMIDGEKLKILDGLDIYSLFGNAVNNAIEYLKTLEDEEKRWLSIKVYVRNQFLCISFENYFEGELEFENDLPKTTKPNQGYHGFGLKSIRYIVDK